MIPPGKVTHVVRKRDVLTETNDFQASIFKGHVGHVSFQGSIICLFWTCIRMEGGCINRWMGVPTVQQQESNDCSLINIFITNMNQTRYVQSSDSKALSM